MPGPRRTDIAPPVHHGKAWPRFAASEGGYLLGGTNGRRAASGGGDLLGGVGQGTAARSILRGVGSVESPQSEGARFHLSLHVSRRLDR